MCNKLILFSIAALFISCNDSGLDGLKENGPQVVAGKVFDVFKGDTLFNENVEVTIDGNTFYTNNGGEFLITDIEPGDHQLIFNSENHLYSDTVITINDKDTTSLTIQLAQKWVDFFPLGENIDQEYLGETNRLSWDPTGADSIDIGSKTKFRSITSYTSLPETDALFRYHLETINDGYIVNYESKNSIIQNADTTYTNSRYLYAVNEDKSTSELSFELIEGPSTIFGISGPFYERSYVVYNLGNGRSYYGEFKGRYLPKSRSGKELFIDGGFYTVKADTGLTSYQYSYQGHTGKGSTTITLDSFKN